MNTLDLIRTTAWKQSVFTTYALSLSFFEVAVLEAIVRSGGSGTLILADVEGVRAALMERGVRRVGRDYDVEPIAVSTGVFHPKVSALIGEHDCHLLVGSGNITFGGWGSNLEVIEHLHPSFAPDVFRDAARFFEEIATSDRLRHSDTVVLRCEQLANSLDASMRGQQLRGDIRLLSGFDGGIGDKLVAIADDLGGARRLAVMAPFWDGPRALDELCNKLGLTTAFVHSHPAGSVEGQAGSNWPFSARTHVQPVTIDLVTDDRPRRLHAKSIEIMCRKGRVLVSGSPNLTTAALGSNRNVEACIVRIQRDRMIGWPLTPATAPVPTVDRVDPLQASPTIGVLRATLEGARIHGTVLTPTIRGQAHLAHLTEAGSSHLGGVFVGDLGQFELAVPALEVQAWHGGRLVVRVVCAQSGKQAEGFVSIAAYAEIVRRSGPIAAKLFALLAGTEAPADVAAIWSWFHEDPSRLGESPPASGGGSGGAAPLRDEEATVPVADLTAQRPRNTIDYEAVQHTADAGWQRFMQRVLDAFRERRGPLEAAAESRGDGEDEGAISGQAGADPGIPRALHDFERLLEALLSPENSGRYAMIAFDLTQYVSERLLPEPDIVRGWLNRVVDKAVLSGPPKERHDEIAAAVIIALGNNYVDKKSVRAARAKLRRLSRNLFERVPSMSGVAGYQRVLGGLDTGLIWSAICETQTLPELVDRYLAAVAAGKRSQSYAELEQEAKEEWSILDRAFDLPVHRQRIIKVNQAVRACPECHRDLPVAERNNLKSKHLAMTKNCCQNVILIEES